MFKNKCIKSKIKSPINGFCYALYSHTKQKLHLIYRRSRKYQNIHFEIDIAKILGKEWNKKIKVNLNEYLTLLQEIEENSKLKDCLQKRLEILQVT